MKTQATGSFQVKITPQIWAEAQEEAGKSLGRLLIDKEIHGDLEATTQGQMLAAGDGKPGSSGVYVALEKVSGSLHGRKGSFVFYHVGVMTAGVPEMKVTVVPDSGTDELKGLCGDFAIQMANGQHTYVFDYTLTTIE